MARDDARAVPQPVLERAAHDIALPAPRAPVLERPSHEKAPPAPRPVHDRRAGWILSAVVVAAAWTVGWVGGVSWAWHAMTPRYLPRARRRVAGLPASLGPGA